MTKSAQVIARCHCAGNCTTAPISFAALRTKSAWRRSSRPRWMTSASPAWRIASAAEPGRLVSDSAGSDRRGTLDEMLHTLLGCLNKANRAQWKGGERALDLAGEDNVVARRCGHSARTDRFMSSGSRCEGASRLTSDQHPAHPRCSQADRSLFRPNGRPSPCFVQHPTRCTRR